MSFFFFFGFGCWISLSPRHTTTTTRSNTTFCMGDSPLFWSFTGRLCRPVVPAVVLWLVVVLGSCLASSLSSAWLFLPRRRPCRLRVSWSSSQHHNLHNHNHNLHNHNNNNNNHNHNHNHNHNMPQQKERIQEDSTNHNDQEKSSETDNSDDDWPERHWYSPLCFVASHSPTTHDRARTALIVLNGPSLLVQSESSNTNPNQAPVCPILQHLWDQSSMHVCADGGANRLYHATVEQGDHCHNRMIPQAIVGDLDSLESEVRTYYEHNHGVAIVHRPNQDCNDLDKSLAYILEQQPHNSSITTCWIYGAFGGRLDQEMAAIQAACVHGTKFPQGLWLYSHDNAAILLPPNQHHVLHVPSPQSPSVVWREGPTCGVIPWGGICQNVSTRGLQWNLHQQPLSWGGLVSTSNAIQAVPLHISCTTAPLLVTLEVTQRQQSVPQQQPSQQQPPPGEKQEL